MSSSRVKISKSLFNWTILVGGTLIALLLFGTIVKKSDTKVPATKYEQTAKPDDIVSLENELTIIAKDSTTTDVNLIEDAMQ